MFNARNQGTSDPVGSLMSMLAPSLGVFMVSRCPAGTRPHAHAITLLLHHERFAATKDCNCSAKSFQTGSRAPCVRKTACYRCDRSDTV